MRAIASSQSTTWKILHQDLQCHRVRKEHVYLYLPDLPDDPSKDSSMTQFSVYLFISPQMTQRYWISPRTAHPKKRSISFCEGSGLDARIYAEYVFLTT